MKYILAATEERARAEIVRTAFRRSFHVDEVSTVLDSFDLFRKRRYEFIFIDLDLIGERERGDGDPLRKLRAAVPSAEIIVMTPPERIPLSTSSHCSFTRPVSLMLDDPSCRSRGARPSDPGAGS